MIFEQVASGVGRNFSYLIGQEKTRKGIIVDPFLQAREDFRKSRKTQSRNCLRHQLPFSLQNSFEEFLNLKKNWLEYKRIHGIK